jgi:peroxiredoxin
MLRVESSASLIMKPLIACIALAVSAIAQTAPDFSAKNTKGETVSLADFKGKIVVLEWTNHDCPFVKKHYQSGNLPKLQETYTAKGVVWLTVNSAAEGKQGYLEPSKFAERAAKEGNKASDILVDSDGKVGKAFGAKVTPHLFIISKDGKIAYDGAIDSKATTKPEDIETADKLFANALDAVLAGKEAPNAKNQPYGCGVKY